jgi:hypothetical protein
MLVALSVTLCLCALAMAGTAKVVRMAMARLGLDSTTVLLWFGLAEWPGESRAPRQRARTAKTVRDGATRRRSPHRSLGRRAIRRRPAQQST